jgi:hypothetical protein
MTASLDDAADSTLVSRGELEELRHYLGSVEPLARVMLSH